MVQIQMKMSGKYIKEKGVIIMNTNTTTISKEEVINKLKPLSEGDADLSTLADVIIKMSEETKTDINKIINFISNDIKLRKSGQRFASAMNTFMGEAI